MKTCTRHPWKKQYAGLIEALDAIELRFKEPTTTIKRMYECNSCGAWHFTSKERRKLNIANPFPRPYIYGVIVKGERVWQHEDQDTAEKWAKSHKGTVVPFEMPRPVWKRLKFTEAKRQAPPKREVDASPEV